MKKTLIISTSLRGNSNSHMLAEEFSRGASEVGNEVEIITLHHNSINFCTGCLSCVKTGKCVIKDEAPEIVEKMHDADVLVFATPIYYYEECFDRARLGGSVFAGGVTTPGEIKDHPALKTAYDLGENI